MRPALGQLRNKPNLTGVEIGVFRGNHAMSYLRCLDIKRVFLIDPYTKYEDYDQLTLDLLRVGEERARRKLKCYKNKIIWIKNMAAEAVDIFDDESLDFVYIDGNHQYRFVMEDMTLYYPKVKKGGLFSGHDYVPKPGRVFEAVNKFCKDNDLKLEIGGIDWWAWKQ